MIDAIPAATVKVLIGTLLWQAVRLVLLFQDLFTRVSINGGSGSVLQAMPLQGVAELVVTEAERSGGRALVEAVAAERIFKQLALIIGNGRAEVVGGWDR
jgi:hypothetical protein